MLGGERMPIGWVGTRPGEAVERPTATGRDRQVGVLRYLGRDLVDSAALDGPPSNAVARERVPHRLEIRSSSARGPDRTRT